MNHPALVIGAGPAGLAAAHSLLQAGRDVLCLESAATSGGMLRTVRRDGFLAEEGPHSMRLAAGAVREFLKNTGADATLIEADHTSAKKFLTCGGKPVAAPTSPLSAISSPLLSFGQKLRFACEPFVPRRASEEEESMAAFVRRRMGPGAYDRMVDAVVGGIYAGDGETLSVQHAFPSLHAFEHRHGSLVRGALAGREARRLRGPLRVTGFAGGMADLASSLATGLGERLACGATLTALDKAQEGWRAHWTDTHGQPHAGTFGDVIITAPAHRWSTLPLPASLAGLGALGQTIPYPPVAVVTLGYDRAQVAHPLDGFGVLTPAREKRQALGVLFTSSIFPGRAPAGAVTLALFIGGTRQPGLAQLPQAELIALARRECEALLGARGEPVFTHAACWAHAIPQYTLGHGARMAALAQAEAAHPGLHFAGNFRGGPALSAALEAGITLGRQLAAG